MSREYRAFKPANEAKAQALDYTRHLTSPEQITEEGLAARGYVVQTRVVGEWKHYEGTEVDPEIEVERLRGIIAEAREVFANSIPGEGSREGTDDAMDIVLMRSGVKAAS